MRRVPQVREHLSRLRITKSIMGSVFGKVDEYESPAYELISKTDTYQIRSYAKCIAIDGPDTVNNEGNGFRSLAQYIGVGSQPMNEKKEAISMTTPVVTYNTGNDSTRMQFILPSKLDAPPNPTDSALELKQRERAIYAVSTFSGSVDHHESYTKRDELVEQLKKDKVLMMDPLEWEFYRYNPPWTLPWLRTNEVAIKLQPDQFEEK